MISALLAAALHTQPAPAPCVPDLQAAGQQLLPCAPPKPVLMAVRNPGAPLELPIPVPPVEKRGPDKWPLPRTEPMPNAYRQPSRCGPIADEITRRIETSAPQKKMAATYAVMRQVDGCFVPSPVGYHPDYLAPGAADPQSAKPADGPGRRR